MAELLKGAGYALSGFGQVLRPGLRRFVIIPVLVNTVLFTVEIVWALSALDSYSEDLVAALPEWLQWLRWLLWSIVLLALLLVSFFSFALLASLIAAPFNGMLAEAVEQSMTGQARGSDASLLAEIFGSLAHEFRKLGYFALRGIVLLIFLIPPLTLIAPLVFAVFGAWMFALEYLDYPMSNRGLRFAEMRARLAGRRWMSFGFGLAVTALFLVPLLNFLVMPAAVIGATRMSVLELQSSAG